MLTAYNAHADRPVVVSSQTGIPQTAIWIDAFDPDESELETLSALTKVRMPRRSDLVEIESSSRLSKNGAAIVISFPAIVRDGTDYPAVTPVGFVITDERVVTIRYAALHAFELAARQIGEKAVACDSGPRITVTLLETIVDMIADLLEHIGADLDALSQQIFANGPARPHPGGGNTIGRALTLLLKNIGRSGDLNSKVSQSLLALSRSAPYIASNLSPSQGADVRSRLDTIANDAHSLHEFQEHLSNKTQFLLDTLLGLANIEQNNVFRVLTVVSVVGIPPTFFASLYGMNFKSMPELDWPHGYAYGLTVIAISAVVPAVWFKIKRWW